MRRETEHSPNSVHRRRSSHHHGELHSARGRRHSLWSWKRWKEIWEAVEDRVDRLPGDQAHPLEARWRANRRFIIRSSALLVVALAVAVGWREWMVRRLARQLWSQAEAAAADEEFARAANLAYRGLGFGTLPRESRVKMLEWYFRSARTRQDFARLSLLCREALPDLKDNLTLYRFAAESALRADRPEQAASQATAILHRWPGDSATIRILVLARYALALGVGPAAIRDVERMAQEELARHPGDVELAVTLATMYRAHSLDETPARRAALADGVMHRLCAARRAGPEAFLARFKYRRSYGLPGAESDVTAAKRFSPDDPEVIFAEGSLALDRNDLETAARAFANLVRLRPHDPRGYLGQGEAAWLAGDYAEALRVWTSGTAAIRQVNLLLEQRVAEAELRLGQIARARQAHQRAQDLLHQVSEGMSRTEWLQIRAALEILRARLEAADGNHERAAEIYSRALFANSSVWPVALSAKQQVKLLNELANCYRAMGEIDRAATTLDEVRRWEPGRSSSYLQAAAAWEAAGNLAAAAQRVDQAAQLDPDNPAVWTATARLELRRLRELPPEQRRPEGFYHALERARLQGADPPTLAVLESDAGELSGQAAAAEEKLTEALTANPTSATLLEALALFHAKHGQRARAEEYVTRHAELGDNALANAVLKATVLLHTGTPAEARQVLDSPTSAERQVVTTARRFELAQLALRAGDVAEARRRLRELAQVRPSTRAYRLQAQLAIEQQDWQEVLGCERALQELEGRVGTLWRYLRAVRLLESVASPSAEALDEAGQLADYLQTQRHAWATGHVLGGIWSEHRSDENAAIDAYQTAVELGERRLSILSRLLKLLVEQGRFAEASRYVDLIAALDDRPSGALQEETDDLLLNVALREQQLGRALELAQARVERDPQAAPGWLWLAESYLLSGSPDEAILAGKRALELAPADHRSWAGLLSLYARTGQLTEIQLVLDSLVHGESLPDGVREFALAQGYELLGQNEASRGHYLRAIELAPDVPAVQRAAGNYFQTRDVTVALRCWRSVLAAGPTSRLTRQVLIELLLTQPGDAAWREAWSLLDQQDSAAPRKPDDIRLAVRVLLRRNTAAQRRQARELLEQLRQAEGAFSDEDRFVLAQLAAGQGDESTAEELYRELINRLDAPASHWLAYGKWLLGRDRVAEAAACAAQLVARDDRSFDSLVLQARCLRAEGKDAELREAIERWFAVPVSATDPTGGGATAAALSKGQLCLAAGWTAEAERWLRRAGELDPAQFAPLAQCLAEQARLGEALAACRQAAERGQSPAAARVAVQIVSQRGGTPSELDQLEPLVAAALQDYPDDLDLLADLGTFRFLQGNLAESERLLRQVALARPDHVPALSNLAMLLSQKSEGAAEARGLVERAIEVAGPQEELLDTLAVVHLRLGEAEVARRLLEEIVAAPTAAPTWWMHLAQAQRTGGDLAAALASLRTAHERGISTAVLVPAEREMLARLDQELHP